MLLSTLFDTPRISRARRHCHYFHTKYQVVVLNISGIARYGALQPLFVDSRDKYRRRSKCRRRKTLRALTQADDGKCTGARVRCQHADDYLLTSRRCRC